MYRFNVGGVIIFLLLAAFAPLVPGGDPLNPSGSLRGFLEFGFVATSGIIAILFLKQLNYNHSATYFNRKSFILPLSGLVVWQILSVFWSLSPTLTLVKSLEYLLMIISLIAVSEYYKNINIIIETVFNYLLVYIMILLLANLYIYGSFIAFVGIEEGGRPRFVLSYAHPLATADILAMCLLLGLNSNRRCILRHIILALLAILIFLTDGRAPIAGILCAVLVYKMMQLNFVTRLHIIIAFSTATLFVTAADSFLNNSMINKSLEAYLVANPDLSSLNGRHEVWDSVSLMSMESSIFGVGYGASRFFLIGETKWGAGQAHNMFIDSYISNGIIGLTLFLIYLFLSMQHLKYVSVFLTITIYVVIHGVFNSILISPGVPAVVTILVIIAASRWTSISNDSSSRYGWRGV